MIMTIKIEVKINLIPQIVTYFSYQFMVLSVHHVRCMSIDVKLQIPKILARNVILF